MNPERDRQIMQVLEAAQELTAAERPAFLAQACAGDPALRREVESLLVHDEAEDDFLSGRAVAVAADLLAETPSDSNAAPAHEAVSSHSAPTEITAQLAPGVTLDGRYLIESELGRGGIGVVFLAQDLGLSGRRVAIKVLLERSWQTEQSRRWFEKKFRDEITALARIDHPGVVQPLSVGQLPDGRCYLVMQYVAGQPLSRLISSTGMALPRAADLLQQIAQALAAAHALGIIHRDLKPGNILWQTIDGKEQIKLIDFGLAAVRDAFATNVPGRPETTSIAGTPPYMAPEQLRGAPEPASDIYALGVIAYQLVTGRLPFAGASVSAVKAEQQAGIKTPPRDLRPDLPVAAQNAILKALAPAAQDRYAGPTAFSEDFARAVADGVVEPPPIDPYQTNVTPPPGPPGCGGDISPVLPPIQPTTTRRRWAWLSGGVLALLLLSALAWYVQRQNAEKRPPDGVPAVTLPMAAERVLNYSLLVQKNPRRHPAQQPFVTLGGISVAEGDGLRFTLSSAQSGHLYIINEWPSQPHRPLGFTVLFPNPFDNRGSAQVAADQVIQLPPDEHWLRFEQEKGMEKYWLVWAEQSVPELEPRKSEDAGEIRDPRRIEAVQRFLAAHPSTEFKAEPDEARRRIKLTGNGKVLIGLATLEHR